MTNLQASGTTTTPNVAVGPAGRALAHPMDPALLDALQQHLTMERRASAFYFANALWFGERELRGFLEIFPRGVPVGIHPCGKLCGLLGCPRTDRSAGRGWSSSPKLGKL